MRKNSRAPGCSAFIRWYCCIAGVGETVAVLMEKVEALYSIRASLQQEDTLRVLAVDTTTERGSVAVVSGGEVLGEVRLRSGMGHSKRLMPAVAFLLDGLGISAPEVEGYAVTAGPGLLHRASGWA